jgi:F-type H+-transporting ATPase subunit alpha
MKKYAGSLRLDLAQFRELEAFAQMGTELDAATQQQLDRGQRLVEILKQGQYVPMEVEEQVTMIYIGTQGLADKVPVEKIKDYEVKFIEYMKSSHKDILEGIKNTGELKEVDQLEKAAKDFTEKYVAGLN